MKDADLNIKKLPLYAGQKLMDLVHFLNDKLVANISELIYDKKPLVWEMFCSPESWLTAACRSEGLKFSRINLAQGFDLYKPKVYEELKKKYKLERPRRIWVSTRCTVWCPFTSLNFRTEEQRVVLEQRRRKERANVQTFDPLPLGHS